MAYKLAGYGVLSDGQALLWPVCGSSIGGVVTSWVSTKCDQKPCYPMLYF